MILMAIECDDVNDDDGFHTNKSKILTTKKISLVVIFFACSLPLVQQKQNVSFINFETALLFIISKEEDEGSTA
jgi:hypothetical protein